MFLPLLLADGSTTLPIRTHPIVTMEVTEFFREGEKVILGSHLMTNQEIDAQVDRVIEHAEHFRRAAKHQLDLAQTRAARP